MIKKWETVQRQLLGDYNIFKLRRDTCRSPRTGQTHPFYVLDAGDWVNVIPVTPRGQVVLVRQYRQGTERITLEIPGGMVDPTDASPAESARRELLEETGYAAERLIPIGVVSPNPAFLNNRCHTYLAPGARPAQPPTPDGREELAVEEVDLRRVAGLIAAGQIDHALVVAAFYHLEGYRRAHPEWQPGHPARS